MSMYNGSIQVLLVEDNPGDVRLTKEALKEGELLNQLTVVGDGVEALSFLRKEGKYVDALQPELEVGSGRARGVGVPDDENVGDGAVSHGPHNLGDERPALIGQFIRVEFEIQRKTLGRRRKGGARPRH